MLIIQGSNTFWVKNDSKIVLLTVRNLLLELNGIKNQHCAASQLLGKS